MTPKHLSRSGKMEMLNWEALPLSRLPLVQLANGLALMAGKYFRPVTSSIVLAMFAAFLSIPLKAQTSEAL